jgi:hypothetical protein
MEVEFVVVWIVAMVTNDLKEHASCILRPTLKMEAGYYSEMLVSKYWTVA